MSGGETKGYKNFREAEREFIIDCIRLYKNLPSLWKVKSEEYSDRNQKKKDYTIMFD